MSSALGSRNVILPALVLVVLAISGSADGSSNRYNIRLVNNCGMSVWPAWYQSGNRSQICPGGTVLEPSQEYTFYPSTLWSGSFWARTGCSFNDTTRHGPCETGGCNGSFGCNSPGEAPFTAAIFAPNRRNNSMDYHISFLHGFNVPIEISGGGGGGGGGNCSELSCPCSDTKEQCPADLVVISDNKKVGCQSACDKFKDDEHCCRGNFTSACPTMRYSSFFKNSCRDAIAYPTDRDGFKICTLAATYVVTFCPEDTKPAARNSDVRHAAI